MYFPLFLFSLCPLIWMSTTRHRWWLICALHVIIKRNKCAQLILALRMSNAAGKLFAYINFFIQKMLTFLWEFYFFFFVPARLLFILYWLILRKLMSMIYLNNSKEYNAMLVYYNALNIQGVSKYVNVSMGIFLWYYDSPPVHYPC